MGGQTALNTAIALDDDGTLKKFNVELIGANRDAIETAEDRALFREAMDRIGLENPRATIVEAPKTAKGRDIAEGCAARRRARHGRPARHHPPRLHPRRHRRRRRLQPRGLRGDLPRAGWKPPRSARS
jgi:hypothetical protein